MDIKKVFKNGFFCLRPVKSKIILEVSARSRPQRKKPLTNGWSWLAWL